MRQLRHTLTVANVDLDARFERLLGEEPAEQKAGKPATSFQSALNAKPSYIRREPFPARAARCYLEVLPCPEPDVESEVAPSVLPLVEPPVLPPDPEGAIGTFWITGTFAPFVSNG
jgi:hypothetical protein